MKEEKQVNLSERQFSHELEEYAEENPQQIKNIVEESKWFKTKNQKISNSHASLYEALKSKKA